MSAWEFMSSENDLLDVIGDRYRAEGYQFIKHPPKDVVPAFLEGLVPDAIALKSGDNVIIEVKQSSRTDRGGLVEFAKRVQNKSGWKLRVYSFENEKVITIDVSDLQSIDAGYR